MGNNYNEENTIISFNFDSWINFNDSFTIWKQHNPGILDQNIILIEWNSDYITVIRFCQTMCKTIDKQTSRRTLVIKLMYNSAYYFNNLI